MAYNNPSTATSSTTATATATTTTTNIRQSTRQTRSNPSRLSKTAGRSSFVGQHGNNLHGIGGGVGGSGGSVGGGTQANSMPHGLYPGITHFSDAIDALPREFRRHSSLLSEVDGKAWALEEQLPKLLHTASEMITKDVFEQGKSARQKVTGPPPESSPETTNRRQVFQNIRSTLSDLLGTIDEKNHVARNANMALKKDVARLDAVYPYVQREVSDEARLGSLTHWAYLNKPVVKTTANERPRRETAGTNNQRGHHDVDEPRREATTRRQRRNQAEHDADELRAPSSRKGKSGPKSRAVAENDNNMATTIPTTKRRKVETSQAAATSTAMERSVSAATNTTSGRAAAKEFGAAAETGKKRTRAPNASTAGARKRTNTAASTAGSPPLVPIHGIPSQAMSAKASSPAPSVRSQASKQNQASAQPTTSRQRPSSSASSRMPNSSMFPGPGPNPLDHHSNEPIAAEKGNLDAKSMATARDMTGPKGELISRTGATNGDSSNKPSPAASSSRHTGPELKREDGMRAMSTISGTDNYQNNLGSKREPSQGIDTVIPPTTKSRSSKTSTPVAASLAETPRTTRPSRTGDGPTNKRGNKKAGPNASRQTTAAAASTPVMQEVGPDLPLMEDEDDEFEPRYCYCNEVSFGEMVACDNTACPREWFHLSCVGMTRPPSKSVVWYCNECKEALKKGRGGGK